MIHVERWTVRVEAGDPDAAAATVRRAIVARGRRVRGLVSCRPDPERRGGWVVAYTVSHEPHDRGPAPA